MATTTRTQDHGADENGGVVAAASSRDPVTITRNDIEVPFYEEDGIVLRLRQQMISIEDHGGVSTGSGLGGDFIELEWKGKTAVVYARDLLALWVGTFDPDDAARLPRANKELAS